MRENNWPQIDVKLGWQAFEFGSLQKNKKSKKTNRNKKNQKHQKTKNLATLAKEQQLTAVYWLLKRVFAPQKMG